MNADRVAFLQRSKERLARRRAELAEAFRRELESKTDRIKAAKELLDDDEEDFSELTRRLAAHMELGSALRELAAEIDLMDSRMAAIDAELRETTQDSQ